jgi:hypothetical protein
MRRRRRACSEVEEVLLVARRRLLVRSCADRRLLEPRTVTQQVELSDAHLQHVADDEAVVTKHSSVYHSVPAVLVPFHNAVQNAHAHQVYLGVHDVPHLQ